MSDPHPAPGGEASYLNWLTPTETPTDSTMPSVSGAATETPGESPGTRSDPSVILIAGAHGGAGTSVLTLLVAMIAASETDGPVIALDGTPVGGDLTARAPAQHCHPLWWQQWLTGDRNPAADPAALPTSGWSVLGRDRSLGEADSPLPGAISALRARGRTVIVDAGASVGSAWFDRIAVSADHIVLTIDDRSGAANASRPVLSMLRRRLGPHEMGRSVHLVVTSQRPGVDHVTGPLADALSGRVAGVHHLPYDTEIAAGVGIDPALLSSTSFTVAHHLHTRTLREAGTA